MQQTSPYYTFGSIFLAFSDAASPAPPSSGYFISFLGQGASSSAVVNAVATSEKWEKGSSGATYLLIGGVTCTGATSKLLELLYLGDYSPCVSGLSAVNATITQLRHLMNSGMTRCCLIVWMGHGLAERNKGKKLMRKHQIQQEC